MNNLLLKLKASATPQVGSYVFSRSDEAGAVAVFRGVVDEIKGERAYYVPLKTIPVPAGVDTSSISPTPVTELLLSEKAPEGTRRFVLNKTVTFCLNDYRSTVFVSALLKSSGDQFKAQSDQMIGSFAALAETGAATVSTPAFDFSVFEDQAAWQSAFDAVVKASK